MKRRTKKQRRSYTNNLKLPKYVQKEVDIKLLNKLRKQLSRGKKLEKFLAKKEKYSMSTLSYRELKKFGGSREDIINYYQRELDLLTGAYDIKRQQQYVDNYYGAMLRAGIDIDIANKVYDKMQTYIGKSDKKFDQMINEVDDIGLYYPKSDSEYTDDLINEIENNLDNFIERN